MHNLLALLALTVVPIAQRTAPVATNEEVSLSRYLTAEERLYLQSFPLSAVSSRTTAAPTGPVHCAAEYEPMAGILLAWEGSSSRKTILAKMAANITTIGGADVYIAVDTAGGGGNYHFDALAGSYATRLIVNENPSLTEAQPSQAWCPVWPMGPSSATNPTFS